MKKDHVVGIAVFLIGVVCLVYAMSLQIKVSTDDPGSRLFPVIGSVMMVICGAGLFFTAKEDSSKRRMQKDEIIRLVSSFGVLVAYVFALKYVGFYISTVIALYVLISLFAYENKIVLWKKALFSIVVTGIVWFVFRKLLLVLLPAGIFF